MNDYIKSDITRYFGSYNLKNLIKGIKQAPIRFQIVFRLCQGLYQSKGIKKYIGLVMWKLNRTKRTIQLPINTRVGYGLYIGHGGPIVINSTTVIGNNCNLSQFTTIGSNSSHAATIGDNVYIGPNVCIVEDVVIGNNVTIGAGSVVTKDIPDNATAVGNYAKVINYNNPGRYINNRWKP